MNGQAVLCKKGNYGAIFLVVSCVQIELDVGGGGFYGYFWELEQPLSAYKCI